ncbi:sialidase family protein [Negadavirga shengliensis]|uniref:Sialidase family protein n=1 Tax=Negadavirga shengliensis TaxID=1389218 RepID=A0ABV9SYM0_9BACT
MKIISRDTVRMGAEQGLTHSKTFPAMEILPSGRILVGFRAAEKKTDPLHKRAMMTWSDDGGRSWREPFEPLALPAVEGRTGQSQTVYFLSLGGERVFAVINWVDHSEPENPYYDPHNESLKDTRIFTSMSMDGGATWGDAQLMDTSGAGGPVPLTGPPFKLRDGRIACQFEINKYAHDAHEWVHRSSLIFSQDEGKSWGDMVTVTREPGKYYWDQRPNVLQDGTSVVNFFWTFDGVTQSYLNIHASLSEDGGRSWSKLWDTGIYGQPGRPIGLRDGRIVTIDIDRSEVPVISVRISDDLGQTYSQSLEIYRQGPAQDSKRMDMNRAWEEMYKFSVGHPQLLYLDEHSLMAYYYVGHDADHTEIAYVKISMP